MSDFKGILAPGHRRFLRVPVIGEHAVRGGEVGNPITVLEWSALFERRELGDSDSWWRRQTAIGEVDVSTVWLGLDHSCGGPPLFWETMVFGDKENDQRQWRHPSREAAFAAHDQIVAAMRRAQGPRTERKPPVSHASGKESSP